MGGDGVRALHLSILIGLGSKWADTGLFTRAMHDITTAEQERRSIRCETVVQEGMQTVQRDLPA